MKKAKVIILRNKKYQIKVNLILKEEKVYILKDEELWTVIIQLYHNILVVEHGKDKRQLLEQLGRRAKHFKSLRNLKSIV